MGLVLLVASLQASLGPPVPWASTLDACLHILLSLALTIHKGYLDTLRMHMELCVNDAHKERDIGSYNNS